MEPQTQKRRLSTRARVVLGVVAGIVVLMVLTGFVTSSPEFCGSCHETAPSYATWAESAHTGVKCVTCHETPREWYGQPLRAVERTRLLARDTWRHLTGRLGEPNDPSAIGRTSPMPDEICLQCHAPDRKATSGFRILIDHVEHSERTGSCVACHDYTAHPDPVLGKPLSLMTKCYDCHGTAEQPEASDECATCHPADFDLRPPSHLEDPWMRDHGYSATNTPGLCDMCHEQSYCTDCHGVEMPHPEWWLEGDPGHGPTVEQDGRDVCFQCHTAEPDSCAACHHQGYDPTLGPWLDQHYDEVRAVGTASCLECHEPLFCATCHEAPAEVGQ